LPNAVKAQFRAETSKFVQHLSVLLVQAVTPTPDSVCQNAWPRLTELGLAAGLHSLHPMI
jgi:hypothetical protein